MARPSGLYIKKKAPGGAAAGAIMRQEVRQDMQKVAARVVHAYNRVVANWSEESKPEFAYAVESGAERVSIRVYVKQGENSLQFRRWEMVDIKGRKGGKKIRAKQRGKPMRFTKRHAKTLAGPARSGGSGEFYGEFHSVYEVTQGAVAPRNFTAAITEAANEEVTNGIRRGYRRAFRRIFSRSI